MIFVLGPLCVCSFRANAKLPAGMATVFSVLSALVDSANERKTRNIPLRAACEIHRMFPIVRLVNASIFLFLFSPPHFPLLYFVRALFGGGFLATTSTNTCTPNASESGSPVRCDKRRVASACIRAQRVRKVLWCWRVFN